MTAPMGQSRHSKNVDGRPCGEAAAASEAFGTDEVTMPRKPAPFTIDDLSRHLDVAPARIVQAIETLIQRGLLEPIEQSPSDSAGDAA
jgi:hypothetical protein